MPAKTKTAKKAASKPTKLRGSVESTDWRGDSRRQASPKDERGGAHQNGVAGFDFVHLRYAPIVLANGSMSPNTKGDCHARSATKMPKASLQSLARQREISQKLVENDLVDCVETSQNSFDFQKAA